jgi:glycosyltransferase involved in cell wall biosynthesis
MRHSDVTVIIPAYNEESSIASVVATVLTVVPNVVVVNDCSNDETAKRAEAAGATVLSHERNRGYDGALETGFQYAIGQGWTYLFTYDADGQHSAKDLSRMIETLKTKNLDLAIGIRPDKARWSERLLGLYSKIRFGIHDPMSGLKGYHRRLVEAYGGFSKHRMIGSELSFFGVHSGFRWFQMPITIFHSENRLPRFRGILSGNEKILKATLKAIRIYGFRR